MLSADYTVLFINNAACRHHRISKESAIGRKCFELYGESEPCQNCPLQEVVETGRPVEKEIFRTKEKNWHLLRAFPVDIDGGEIVVGMISKDISATKTAEQVLVDFNYKIKNFIDRKPIGCILWDEAFKVSMWNPAAEKIFGYTEAEARGKHPYEIIVPEDMIPKTDSVKQQLNKGNDNSHRTGENITKDGRRIYCSWLNTPIQDVEGEVIAVLSMAQDITYERQMQNEAIRSAQLASIGQLAANVAHEINNPINGVINYCQLLLNDRERLEPKQIDILERTIREGDRIAVIVKSLLNFARKPSDSMVPQDIGQIVNEAIELLRPEIRKSGIAVSIELQESNPVMKCNPQQVEQVIINVLKNAIDALCESSQEEKEIVISSNTEQEGSQKVFRLVIANNGPHIPPHLQEKIFEPFMTTKENGAGTGLGLGISLEIMKNHGGTIVVNSSPNESTQMTLVFPLWVFQRATSLLPKQVRYQTALHFYKSPLPRRKTASY